MRSSEPKPDSMSFGQFVNIAVVVLMALSAPIQVCFHKRLGERFLGTAAALAVPGMLMFSAADGGRNSGPLFGFVGFYLMMCFFARVGMLWRRFCGKKSLEHSRYDGVPRLKRLMPWFSELTVKRIEGVLVACVGFLILPLTVPLGAYFIAGGVALVMNITLYRMYQRERALDLHDVVIDQTEVAGNYRDLHREG